MPCRFGTLNRRQDSLSDCGAATDIWGISAVGRTNHQQLRPASSSSFRRICTKFGRDFWGISAVGRTNHQQLRPASSSSYRRICTKFGRDFWGISAVGSARHSHCRGQRFESAMLHTKPRHFALVFSLPTFSLKPHTGSAGADSPTTGNKAYLFISETDAPFSISKRR